MAVDDDNGADQNGSPTRTPVGELFRQVNDHIRELAGRLGGAEGGIFVCECEDGECFAPIDLTVAEYDAVRSLNPGGPLLAHHAAGTSAAHAT